ncbi:MAG: hypothetical protein DWI12_11305 [Planctomycetota bacterium]|nr:MAG: hypothetical protein DWI12_11305 [Planctomycetota bacterium]
MSAPSSTWSSNANSFAELLHQAAEVMRNSPLRDKCVVRLPRRGELLATGDIHDNTQHLNAVLRAARLDESPDHHVVLHELIHGERLVSGMDMSHRMLARVAQLVLAHPLQVHPILANHEIAQYRGQHISKGAGDNLELFDAGLEYVFGDDAQIAADAIGVLVRAMPLAILCDNGVMVSHSLPSSAMMKHFDARVFERELYDEDFDGPYGAAYLMTWGRGQTPEHLESLAREWGRSLFIAGHAHAPSGIDVRSPNMVILNSDHEQARAVVIDLAADAPTAQSLVDHAIAIQSYFDLDASNERPA